MTETRKTATSERQAGCGTRLGCLWLAVCAAFLLGFALPLKLTLAITIVPAIIFAAYYKGERIGSCPYCGHRARLPYHGEAYTGYGDYRCPECGETSSDDGSYLRTKG